MIVHFRNAGDRVIFERLRVVSECDDPLYLAHLDTSAKEVAEAPTCWRGFCSRAIP